MVESRPDDQPSLATLVGNILDNTGHLVRQEINLVKAEIRSQVRDTIATTGKGVGLLAGAGVFALIGLAFLGVTLMLGLNALLTWPLWLSALVVTLVYFAAAGALAFVGRAILQRAGDESGAPAVQSGDNEPEVRSE